MLYKMFNRKCADYECIGQSYRLLSLYEVDFNEVLIVTTCELADSCGLTYLLTYLIPSLQNVENLSIQHITIVFS